MQHDCITCDVTHPNIVANSACLGSALRCYVEYKAVAVLLHTRLCHTQHRTLPGHLQAHTILNLLNYNYIEHTVLASHRS